ncbi:MAG: ribosomal protein S18-alanine N-acetyltransferase [Bacteroidota bacterium]
MPVNIAAMTLADLDGVLEIENLAFASPWSRESFRHELTENTRAVYIVADDGTAIVGYIGMWVIFEEGHITNLAVHPNCRRQGIASRLLSELCLIAKERGVQRLTLEVRRSNIGAQLLYARHGFICSGVRRRYYRDNNEDAFIMWKSPI